jgi:hypothetical protein
MHHHEKTVISILLISCAIPAFTQFQQVDYRYAPQWYVSCIGLPDDTCKAQIGPLGQLLTDYSKEIFSILVKSHKITVEEKPIFAL